MVQAVRGGRTDPFARGPEKTSDAMVGEAQYLCVDCDLRQVEPMRSCPACGGVVVASLDMEEAGYDPLIGRKIGGRFTVVARLGSGSMGAVYRARQDGMSREVALKVLKPERAFDETSKARFEREARATSALTSPHTVTVYDFGEDASTGQGALLYLAMEKLTGESLGQRLKRVGRLPPAEAVKIVQQALRSLAEAHERGVVHRDLKPDNIYLHQVPTPSGTEEVAKILDFGIAKILQPDLKVDSLETQAGTVFGTPRYMSPEQAQSKPLDGRSDLYTIALILFQMLTGRHCFPDDDAVVVMARHIQSHPPGLREVAPDAGIPETLEAVVLQTLAKDPGRRPQTALELHEALTAAMRGSENDGAGSDPSLGAALTSVRTSVDVTWMIAQRRRTMRIAYAVGLATILIGAVSVGGWLARRRARTAVIDPSAFVLQKSEQDEAAERAALATAQSAAVASTPSPPQAPATSSTNASARKPSPPHATTTPTTTEMKEGELARPPEPLPVVPEPVPVPATRPDPPPGVGSASVGKKPRPYGKFD